MPAPLDDLKSPGATELPEDERDEKGRPDGPEVVGMGFHFFIVGP